MSVAANEPHPLSDIVPRAPLVKIFRNLPIPNLPLFHLTAGWKCISPKEVSMISTVHMIDNGENNRNGWVDGGRVRRFYYVAVGGGSFQMRAEGQENSRIGVT